MSNKLMTICLKMKFLFLSVVSFLFCCVSVCLAQNDPKCGTNGPAMSKIVNGEEATPYEFPWTASIGAFYNDVYAPTCTGSIIHPQYILTAGHCKFQLKPNVRVVVGKLSLDNIK